MTKLLDKLIYDHETRRQQMGMPDRWRLLERLDPTVMVIIPDQVYVGSEKLSTWKRLGFARKSELEELRKQYGNDFEVL